MYFELYIEKLLKIPSEKCVYKLNNFLVTIIHKN